MCYQKIKKKKTLKNIHIAQKTTKRIQKIHVGRPLNFVNGTTREENNNNQITNINKDHKSMSILTKSKQIKLEIEQRMRSSKIRS